MVRKTRATPSTGNVFRDLGLPVGAKAAWDCLAEVLRNG